jgi:hypothetical protein
MADHQQTGLDAESPQRHQERRQNQARGDDPDPTLGAKQETRIPEQV